MKSFVLAALVVSASVRLAVAGDLEKAASFGAAAFGSSLAGFKAVLAADEPSNKQKMLDGKLLSAVGGMNIAEIRRLVAMGANPNAYDGYNFTPLTTAVMDHGDLDVMNALFDLGAKADFKGTCDNTALHAAASYGRLEAAKLLVAHKADFDAKACLGETPLVAAAAAGKTEVFAYLLGLGADPNAHDWRGKTPLMLAANLFVARQPGDILDLLLADKRTNANLRDEDGMTVLKVAVKNTDTDLVKRLLQVRGLDLNDDGGGVTALFMAELDHKDEIAALLRAAGAKSAPRAAL